MNENAELWRSEVFIFAVFGLELFLKILNLSTYVLFLKKYLLFYESIYLPIHSKNPLKSRKNIK